VDLLSDNNCKPMLFLRKDIFHKLKTNFTPEMVHVNLVYFQISIFIAIFLVTEDGTDLFLIRNHLLSGKVTFKLQTSASRNVSKLHFKCFK